MKLFAASLLALSVLGTGAHAQTQSCGMELGRWVCRTTQPAPQAHPMTSYEQARQRSYDQQMQFQRQRDAQAAAEQAGIDQARGRAAQHDDAALMANISAAVKDGRCEDAKTYALEANRLDLADQALRVCSTK